MASAANHRRQSSTGPHLFNWVITVILFGLAAWLIKGFRLKNGVISAVLGAVVYAVISTVLLRVSLSTPKPYDLLLALTAMLYGAAVLGVFACYAAMAKPPRHEAPSDRA